MKFAWVVFRGAWGWLTTFNTNLASGPTSPNLTCFSMFESLTDRLTTAIRNERRVELAQEFHRYFDLMRWGKEVAEAALGEKFNYETKRYLPLPQMEIDQNQALK